MRGYRVGTLERSVGLKIEKLKKLKLKAGFSTFAVFCNIQSSIPNFEHPILSNINLFPVPFFQVFNFPIKATYSFRFLNINYKTEMYVFPIFGKLKMDEQNEKMSKSES